MQDDKFTSEVTAQRMSAAFDAVTEVLAVIQSRRHALSHISAGRALVDRADRVATRFPSAQPNAAKDSAA